MPTPVEYVPENHGSETYAPYTRPAPARRERAPMSMEMGLSLVVAVLCLAFWGAYMLMILFGEVPEMLAH